MRAEKAPWRAKRAGQPPRGWARQTELEEYRALTLGRIASLVEVHEPFVLVSQVQRSGGTLVTRLFDGHPEVHVRHGDMEIGYPRKSNWPRIPLEEGPERWFEILYEEKNHKGIRQLLRGEETPAESYYPRWFLPRLQKAIFDHCVQAWDVTTARGVLDAYFTSYFNAWLDNRNLYTGPKKAVLGFAPKMNADPEGLEELFSAYPDGTLVSVVRDPRSWFASAQQHKAQFEEVDRAIESWLRSTEATLAARERHGDRVVVLTYDQLVLDTAGATARVAERIGITESPVLLTPTFNGEASPANSSHRVEGAGILADRTELYRELLDEDTIARIEQQSGDAYERAVAASDLG
jgi:hypothetical protein